MAAALKQWRQRLGYCSLFAAVPAMLASNTSQAHADEVKKPEVVFAGQTRRLLERSRESYSTPELLKRQSDFRLPHQKDDSDLLTPQNGTDDCPGRAIPAGSYPLSAPYIDSGTTIGASNTINRVAFNYYGYCYYGFDTMGPDHIYSFVLNSRGANPVIQVSTTSGTFRPLIYILDGRGPNACPAGTELFLCNELTDSFSPGPGGTATINSQQMANLPLNVPLYLVIDSTFGGAGSSGPYSLRMQDVSIGVFNSIDSAEFFVRQHYLDFLNRDPDAAGLAYWTNEITLCGGDPGCTQVKRVNVSAAFFLSIEFQETGYFVYRANKAAYGNLPGAPVPVTLSEFLPDTQALGVGLVVNQPGWETALENNKQGFLSNLVQRSRFVSAFPSFLSSTQFVDLLFANAGVTPSTNDRALAIGEFGSTSSSTDIAARARALRRVVENSELKQQELNRAFVLMQYFGYLRRNPNEAPEPTLDFQGYTFWLNKLNQFNGNFVDAEMVKAFITSTEYRQRFGQN
jgi:hypothetical protein